MLFASVARGRSGDLFPIVDAGSGNARIYISALFPEVTLNPFPPIEELTPDLLTFRLMPGAILILFLKLAIL